MYTVARITRDALSVSERVGDDARGDEDQQFLLVITLYRAFEQPSDVRDVAQERSLRRRHVLISLEDTAQYYGLAIVHQDLGLNFIGVD